MCKAFSCIVTADRKVYWKAGLDSHNDIVEKFNLKDDKIGQICPVEITPDEGYLHPEGRWTFKFDDQIPGWWKSSYYKATWSAFEKWKKQVYSMINLEEAKNPINPLLLPEVKEVTEQHISLLTAWASVGTSVWASVGTSVGTSVWDSVGTSVWDSVRDSVGDLVWDLVWDSVGDLVGDLVWDSVGTSVRDSVWAYAGSLFVLHEWRDTYPFQSCVELWKGGIIPSFDGKTWRLHTGKDAKVIFEIDKDEM